MSPDQVHPVPVMGKKLHIDYAILLVGGVVPEVVLWLLNQSHPCKHILMIKSVNLFKNIY